MSCSRHVPIPSSLFRAHGPQLPSFFIAIRPNASGNASGKAWEALSQCSLFSLLSSAASASVFSFVLPSLFPPPFFFLFFHSLLFLHLDRNTSCCSRYDELYRCVDNRVGYNHDDDEHDYNDSNQHPLCPSETHPARSQRRSQHPETRPSLPKLRIEREEDEAFRS